MRKKGKMPRYGTGSLLRMHMEAFHSPCVPVGVASRAGLENYLGGSRENRVEFSRVLRADLVLIIT